jgi:hypothetical protein
VQALPLVNPLDGFLRTKKTGVATDATPVEESIKSL